MTHQEIVKIYLWEVLLNAPHSQIAISPISNHSIIFHFNYKIISVWLYSNAPEKSPLFICLFIHKMTHWNRESIIITFRSSIWGSAHTSLEIKMYYTHIMVTIETTCTEFFEYFRWAHTHSVYSHWARLLILDAGLFDDCSSALMHRCELMNNTGSRFRSYVLGVMSPARFPCAMPVLNDWVAHVLRRLSYDDALL